MYLLHANSHQIKYKFFKIELLKCIVDQSLLASIVNLMMYRIQLWQYI